MTAQLLFATTLFAQVAAAQSFVVSGSLVGSDGSPMSLAHVHVASNAPGFPRKAIRSVQADQNGHFSLPFSTPGFYRLEFTGVDHYSAETTVLLTEPRSTSLSVRLKHIEYKDHFDSVLVNGDFNKYSRARGTVKMTKGADGIFTATIKTKSDTLAYQLVRVDNRNHTINGQQADYYVYDGGGDYISVVRVKDGDVTLTFDPRLGQASTSSEVINFPKDDFVSRMVNEVIADIKARKDRVTRDFQAFRSSGGDPDTFRVDWSNDFKEMRAFENQETTTILKDLWLVARIDLAGFRSDSLDTQRAFSSISPRSPLWSFSPQAVAFGGRTIHPIEKRLAYLRDVIDLHSDSQIKPFLYTSLLPGLRETGKDSLLSHYLQRFMVDFPDSPWTEGVKSKFAPSRRIQVGAHVPAFKIPSMDSPNAMYSDSSLRGNIVLIDFWAVWCGPCVSEMKYLHEAYNRYHEQGFAILSISNDFRRSDVQDFRRDKWPMPWLNAFDGPGATSPLAKAFEIVYIPKPILVGRDGIIIATEESLRGEKLLETLATAFQ